MRGSPAWRRCSPVPERPDPEPEVRAGSPGPSAEVPAGDPDPRATSAAGDWLNVPNAISVVRLVVLVPVVIWLMSMPEHRIAATIALAVFGATDWIDGFWARRFGQVTRVGEILDPVADRLGITLICVAMTWFGILPLWMLAVIVLTDVFLGIVGTVRLDATATSHVSWLGKGRTTLIMTGLPILLLSTASQLPDTPLHQVGTFLLSAGVVLHLAAGVDYAIRLIRTPRSRTASRS